MARTLRRRHVPQWESFVLSESILRHTPTGGHWFERVTIAPNSPEGRRRLARFHSDRPYQPGPPKRFRRAYHASDRQTCRGALYRWVHRGDHDFLAPPPHRHGATWDWF